MTELRRMAQAQSAQEEADKALGKIQEAFFEWGKLQLKPRVLSILRWSPPVSLAVICNFELPEKEVKRVLSALIKSGEVVKLNSFNGDVVYTMKKGMA